MRSFSLRIVLPGLLLLFVPLGAASGEPGEQAEGLSQQAELAGALAGAHLGGITAELAWREAGPAAVPLIHTLLVDPEFPRRDNLVAFLGHLAGEESVAPLLTLLRRPPAGLATPAEDRALLLVPTALGRIAARGHDAAGVALRTLIEPGDETLALAASVAPEPGRYRADLEKRVRRGLMLAEGQGARRTDGTTRAGSAAPGEPRGAAPPPLSLQALDDELRVHELGVDFANHEATTFPLNEFHADFLVAEASLALGRADFDLDLACCVGLARTGAVASFGQLDDGLDVIETQAELDQVLADATSRVKVVRQIDYCDGPVDNVLACSERPGDSIVMVRNVNARLEMVGLLHHLGRNLGLADAAAEAERRFMSPDLDAGNLGMTQPECDVFHAPPAEASVTPTDVGACVDVDVDDVHDLLDNCPDDVNNDQSDFDADGTGNACEGPVTLLGPADGTLFYADDPAARFEWEGGAMARFRSEWSRSDTFKKRRTSGAIANTFIEPDASFWLRILRLGQKDGTFYWRVRGRSPSGDSETTETRTLLLAAASPPAVTAPADGAVVDPAEAPTFAWDVGHNEGFRLIISFRPDLGGKPRVTSGSGFALAVGEWTPGEPLWDRIVNRMAPKSADGSIYWVVRARDALGRKTESPVRSFRLGTGGD